MAPSAPSPLPEGVQVVVHRTNPDKTQETLSFFKDLVVVGRVNGNDIVLVQGNISKRHCVIFVIGSDIYIEDKNSTNGTQVNQVSIKEPTKIKPTDNIAVGSFGLRVELLGV